MRCWAGSPVKAHAVRVQGVRSSGGPGGMLDLDSRALMYGELVVKAAGLVLQLVRAQLW